MNIPAISPWYSLIMVVSETIPASGYVITDHNGEILSGGDIDLLTAWIKQQGRPTFIYVNEDVAERLIMGGRENGARYAH